MEGGAKHSMFMDIDEEIRLRVVEEIFVDTSPSCGEGGWVDGWMVDDEWGGGGGGRGEARGKYVI